MPSRLNSNVAKRVTDLRKQQSLTQERLAEAAGLHRTYVGALERGEANLTLDTVERIADALNVDACLLMCDRTAA